MLYNYVGTLFLMKQIPMFKFFANVPFDCTKQKDSLSLLDLNQLCHIYLCLSCISLMKLTYKLKKIFIYF